MFDKRVILYSFTKTGSRQQLSLMEYMKESGIDCRGYTLERFIDSGELLPLQKNWKEELGNYWGAYAFVFIGATGIAVRAIAPYVKDKFSDSPIVVLDERGQFVIPLLSGHMGGAVELSEFISSYTGGISIITTATDVQKKFAVDVFAKKNDLFISNRFLAKKISADILEGKKVGFYSEFEIMGEIPKELVVCSNLQELEKFEHAICISQTKIDEVGNHILLLLPRNLSLGIGCRKGVPFEHIKEQLEKVLMQRKIMKEQICEMGSIDLKKEEQGLLDLADYLNISFYTFSAEELRETGTVENTSDFVKSVTGVDNVCERAAKKLCEKGEVFQSKICMDRITIALVKAEKKIYVTVQP